MLLLLIFAVVVALITRNFPTHKLEETPAETPDGGVPGPPSRLPDPLPSNLPITEDGRETANRLWAIQYARGRLTLPSLFLMGLGAINLVLGALVLTRTVQVGMMPQEDFAKEMEMAQDLTKKLFPQFAPTMDQADMNPARLRHQTMWINGGMSALLLLGSWLMSVGGWRLRNLQSYRMGLVGAVYAALPCVSIAGCCGIGQIVAAWCIFILFDPVVRAAFHWVNQDAASQSPDSHC